MHIKLHFLNKETGSTKSPISESRLRKYAEKANELFREKYGWYANIEIHQDGFSLTSEITVYERHHIYLSGILAGLLNNLRSKVTGAIIESRQD